MTPDLVDLARRAVACKGWRWLPGMRTTDAMRVIHDETLFPGRPCAIREGAWVDTAPPRPLRDALPDLADPATMGCLLALVRHAREESTGFLTPAKGGGWTYWTRLYQADYFLGDTEAEALVAALEAAHAPRP